METRRESTTNKECLNQLTFTSAELQQRTESRSEADADSQNKTKSVFHQPRYFQNRRRQIGGGGSKKEETTITTDRFVQQTWFLRTDNKLKYYYYNKPKHYTSVGFEDYHKEIFPKKKMSIFSWMDCFLFLLKGIDAYSRILLQ